MANHVLWLTARSNYHQQRAFEAAPPTLSLTMLRDSSPDELQQALFRAEVLVSERRGSVDAALLQMAPNLRLVLRTGSLIDDIDLHALRSADVRLVLLPDPGTIMVAEYCMMMTMVLLKRVNMAQNIARNPAPNQRSKRTDENTFSYNWAAMGDIRGLYGKRVGIIGMGEIGVELARRLKSFQVEEVKYYKRTQYPRFVERELGLTYAENIEDTARNMRVIINLLPYTKLTDLVLDAAFFNNLNRGTVFVHAGSGATVDEQALANAINIGHLGGAAVDTYEYEPIRSHNPLITVAEDPVNNLILTPHVAGATLPQEQTINVLVFQEISRFFRDLPLRNEVSLP